MPKAIHYRAGSVVYFAGDPGDRVFILKAGQVLLKTADIETGQEVRDVVSTGEFFGVKSALGKYAREEDALVVEDASVIAFAVPEFEALVGTNTRVTMKMLKVFSTQLRRIHVKVRHLLEVDQQTDPEAGLYEIGEYYMGKNKHRHAAYAFRRYLEIYPSGQFAAEARRKQATAEANGAGRASGVRPGSFEDVRPADREKDAQANATGPAKAYFAGMTQIGNNDFRGAIGTFRSVAESGDREYGVRAKYQIGRCMFELRQFDGAISALSSLVQQNPRMPDVNDAIYYIGASYQHSGDKKKAEGFYRKLLTLPGVDESLKRKTTKALRSMEA